MKPILTLLLCCSQLMAQTDQVKKNAVFIHFIPSNLLVGDIPLGIEHLYKKRFSHELQAYLKCFTPILFTYDKGFRLCYQLKYNFINRNYFRMSGIICTSYKEASFINKKSFWIENKNDGMDLRPMYIMDREFKQFGVGGGIGISSKLTKHWFVGSELLFQMCQIKKSYTVKARQALYGNYYVPLTEPYQYSDNIFSGFSYPDLIANIKISYRL